MNLISGYEIDLETLQLVRQHFAVRSTAISTRCCSRPSRAALARRAELRSGRMVPLRRLPASERRRDGTLGPDPLALAATALGAGVQCLAVTLGSRGVVYFVAPEFAALNATACCASPLSAQPVRLRRLGPGANGASPAAAARSPRGASRVTQRDVATCGGLPISLDCLPVITLPTPCAPHSLPLPAISGSGGPAVSPTSSGRTQPHVTAVIHVPPFTRRQTFEQVLDRLVAVAPDDQAAGRRSAYALGVAVWAHRAATLAQTRTNDRRSRFPSPTRRQSYWARTGFFHHAEEPVRFARPFPRLDPAGESNVLLEITPVAQSDDVHDVVGRIQTQAHEILATSSRSTRRRRSDLP